LIFDKDKISVLKNMKFNFLIKIELIFDKDKI